MAGVNMSTGWSSMVIGSEAVYFSTGLDTVASRGAAYFAQGAAFGKWPLLVATLPEDGMWVGCTRTD